LTFDISLNGEEFTILVMPNQDKRSAHVRSAGVINSTTPNS